MKFVLQRLKSNLRLIVISLVLGIMFGVAVGSLKPYYYRSEARFITFLGSSSASISNRSLLRISKLAGFDFDSEETAFDPALIPAILFNRELLYELAVNNVKADNSNDSISAMDYYLAYEIKSDLRFEDLMKMNERGVVIVDEDFTKVQQSFFKRISYGLDVDTNIFTVGAEFKSPEYAQQVCSLILKYLERYIVNFKLKRKEEELTSLLEREARIENQYDKSGETVVRFLSEHQGVLDEKSKFQLEKLQNEHQINYLILSEIKSQLESKKIEVEEKRPSLYMVAHPSIQLKSSSLGFLLTLALAMAVTGVITIGYIFRDTIMKMVGIG